MHTTHKISKPGERAATRASDLSQNISDYEEMFADLAGAFVSYLSESGALRVHRSWSASEEHRLIAKAAADAAVQVILNSPWVDLPIEVEALHKRAAKQ